MSQDGEGRRRRWLFKREDFSPDVRVSETGGGVISDLILSLMGTLCSLQSRATGTSFGVTLTQQRSVTRKIGQIYAGAVEGKS
jgi:hypothetical protein